MLYSNEDFNNFYVRYKAEALPKNIASVMDASVVDGIRRQILES